MKPTLPRHGATYTLRYYRDDAGFYRVLLFREGREHPDPLSYALHEAARSAAYQRIATLTFHHHDTLFRIDEHRTPLHRSSREFRHYVQDPSRSNLTPRVPTLAEL